jgi:hypothetical protein
MHAHIVKTGMKIEIVNMHACLHETGTKIIKFLIYSLCEAIFFFRCLLLACVVPMSRLQIVRLTAKTGLKCMCVYIHPSLNSCRWTNL